MPKHNDSAPTPADDAQEAIEKSGSLDTRIPEGPASVTSETIVAGAPAAHIPQVGTGLPAGEGDLGEGERVLEQERRAQRAGTDVQRS